MDIHKKCYYDSLEVPKDASLQDIKKKYRELSKLHHPDVATEGCPKRNEAKFKEISEAYRILSDKKEKRRYDFQRADRYWYQNHQGGGGGNSSGGSGFGGYGHYADMRAKAHQGPKAEGLYGVVETMFRPRNFILGIGGLYVTGYLYNHFFAHDSKQKLQQQRHGKEMVEAWYNERTNRYEQPAPWDPTYRRLKPALELVPRDKVQQRTR